MRLPTLSSILLTACSILSLTPPSSSAPTTNIAPASPPAKPAHHLLLPGSPLPTKNLTLPIKRALLVLPTGKSLDITSYTTVPLPRTAYRWALVSIMQDLRSSYDPAAVVEELYKWEEWGVVLRAKTYQYTMVTLTYGGLLQTVEVLAGWLVEEPWVCNGIVREGRSRVGTPVGYVSFELV